MPETTKPKAKTILAEIATAMKTSQENYTRSSPLANYVAMSWNIYTKSRGQAFSQANQYRSDLAERIVIETNDKSKMRVDEFIHTREMLKQTLTAIADIAENLRIAEITTLLSDTLSAAKSDFKMRGKLRKNDD